MPLKYLIGLKQTYKSSSCLIATLIDLIPSPTGVVNGPFIPTPYSLNVSKVLSGSHSEVVS